MKAETNSQTVPPRQGLLAGPKKEALFVLLVFFYSLFVGLILQKGILPTYLPDRSTDGLLHGLDGMTFHQMAVEQAEKIRQEGWRYWEWDPGWSANQPVGWVSAIYAVATPNPGWVLLLNSILQSALALFLLLLLKQLGFRGWAVYVGTVPLLFFPSTLTWVAQIHKDGFFLLGWIFVLLGSLWILLPGKWFKMASGAVFVFAGMACIALVRDYGVYLLAVALVGALFITRIITAPVKFPNFTISWTRIFVLLIVLLLTLPFAGFKESELGGHPHSDEVVVLEESTFAQEISGQGEVQDPFLWNQTKWLPGFVDRSFQRLAYNRQVFLVLFPESGSVMDSDRNLQSAFQVIAYAPKAWMHGLFAPYPWQWFEEGSSPTGTIQRRVAAGEMLLAYTAFVGLLAMILRERRPAFLFVFVTSVLLLLPFAITIPAVGSLYRLRFGPFALLVGIGLAWWVQYISARRKVDNPDSRQQITNAS